MNQTAAEEFDLEGTRAALRACGVSVEAEVQIAGLKADLLMRTPMGQRIVVEIKKWAGEPDQKALDRALHQAELLQQVTGSEHAWIAIPALGEDRPHPEVLGLAGLVHAVQAIVDGEPKFRFMGRSSQPGERDQALHRELPVLFVAMPFASQFDDTFYLGIAHAAERVGMVCVREDQEVFNGSIIDRIHRDIRRADAVVADLSGANPNVLYEVGFAHALEKPTVHISATPPEQLPFDVQSWSTLRYSFGQVHKLREGLIRHLEPIRNKAGLDTA